jgi:hypothetical protein
MACFLYVLLPPACCCFYCVTVSSSSSAYPFAPRSPLIPHGRPSLAAL